MKKLLLVFALFLSIQLIATNFDDGFEAGFKRGYCQQDFGCLPPITPIPPMPTILESDDSWQDGYDEGYKAGVRARLEAN